MGGAPFRGEPPLARVLDPREDDLAVRLDLVQVVAAQTFIAEAGDALQHELIGRLERLARFLRLLVGLQRLAMPPPDHCGGKDRNDARPRARCILVARRAAGSAESGVPTARG